VPNQQPRRNEKSSLRRLEHRASQDVWQSHNPAQDRLARGLYPEPCSESSPAFSTGCQPTGGDLLAVSHRHPGGIRSTKAGRRSVKTWRSQEGLRQENLRTVRHSWTRRPAQGASRKTRREWLWRDDADAEQSGQHDVGCVATTAMIKPFAVSLYLLNEHPFGKWKQGGLFHHDLGSRDKQGGVYKLLLAGTLSRRVNLLLEASDLYAPNRAMRQIFQQEAMDETISPANTPQ
jgi:hypothetical protein